MWEAAQRRIKSSTTSLASVPWMHLTDPENLIIKCVPETQRSSLGFWYILSMSFQWQSMRICSHCVEVTIYFVTWYAVINETLAGVWAGLSDSLCLQWQPPLEWSKSLWDCVSIDVNKHAGKHQPGALASEMSPGLTLFLQYINNSRKTEGQTKSSACKGYTSAIITSHLQGWHIWTSPDF